MGLQKVPVKKINLKCTVDARRADITSGVEQHELEDKFFQNRGSLV